MLKINSQLYIRAKKYTYYLFFVIFCNTPMVFADSPLAKHPYHSDKNAIYTLPNDTTKVSLTELHQLKSKYTAKLKSLQTNNSTLLDNDEELFDSLTAYDNVRLKISDIILKLIRRYKVTGEYRQKLLGYSETFNSRIKTARASINTLEEYKVYSNHFSVVYISLLYTFKENESFYTQYKKDIHNPKSTLGKYRHELAISYKNVEKTHKKYESALHANNLKKIISQLNDVINARNTALSAATTSLPL